MTNIQDIINLCKNEQGKVFVVDEEGSIKLVVMGLEQYQKMLGSKPSLVKIPDPETVNRKIIKAQLEEDVSPVTEPAPINSVAPPARAPRVLDMREEVIDPSFDFDAPVDDLA